MNDHGGEAWGRVLAVRDPDAAGAPATLIVLAHGQAGLAPHVASWHVGDVGDLHAGDLVARDTTAGTLRREQRGAGVWPPERGTPGADLARFDPAHWRRLHARGALLQGLRGWFAAEGFLEVETPLAVPSPGTETHIDPVEVRWVDGPSGATTPRWLIPSPEYAMKRLIAAGSGPIYQLGKVFRGGERGGRHRPEFTLLEWYRPGVGDYEALMTDCERLIRTVAGTNDLNYQGRRYDLRGTWPRLRFFDLLRDRADLVAPERLGPDQWLFALVDRVEATLGVEGPEFLIEWPREMASLARLKADDPRVAERFELYLAGYELANAFGELTDAAEQRARCQADNAERRALGRAELPLDEDFLGALAVGMPPSCGCALGVDRLVMLLTDAARIDDVLTF